MEQKILQSKKLENRILIRLVKFLDVLFVTAIFGCIWMKFYSELISIPYYKKGNYLIIALFCILYYLLAHLYQGFMIHLSRISEIIYAQVLSVIISDGLMYLVTMLLMRRIPNILPLLLAIFCQYVVIWAWSKCAHRWYFKTFEKSRTIIVWDELKGLESLISEYGLDQRYEIIDTVHVDRINPEYMESTLTKAKVVFLCCIHSHERNQIVKYCVEHDISAFVIPRIGDVIMAGAQRMHLMHLPMLLVDRYDPKPEYLFIKRFFDIALSGIALIVLSPVMLLLTVLIRVDGGTALYKQVRLGKNGKEFKVLKFRSMRMDAEKDGIARLSTGDKDDRITKVGHFIRACRLDELPQLINILKGEMSIAGPRPERPEIAQEYMEELPEFSLRLQAKPGLTGYAQVYGKYNTTPYDKLLMDLMYIGKPSLAEDIKICFATVKILFMKDSTEGVAEGKTTASAGSVVNTEVSKERAAEK